MSEVKVVGIDLFFTHSQFAKSVPKLQEKYGSLKPVLLSNRGAKVWPGKAPPLDMTDLFCCRFQSTTDGGAVTSNDILTLLKDVEAQGWSWNHVEKLFVFDGKVGYT